MQMRLKHRNHPTGITVNFVDHRAVYATKIYIRELQYNFLILDIFFFLHATTFQNIFLT